MTGSARDSRGLVPAQFAFESAEEVMRGVEVGRGARRGARVGDGSPAPKEIWPQALSHPDLKHTKVWRDRDFFSGPLSNPVVERRSVEESLLLGSGQASPVEPAESPQEEVSDDSRR